MEYLVKWHGYGSDENQWVNIDQMKAPLRIKEFYARRQVENEGDMDKLFDAVNTNTTAVDSLTKEVIQLRADTNYLMNMASPPPKDEQTITPHDNEMPAPLLW